MQILVNNINYTDKEEYNKFFKYISFLKFFIAQAYLKK